MLGETRVGAADSNRGVPEDVTPPLTEATSHEAGGFVCRIYSLLHSSSLI